MSAKHVVDPCRDVTTHTCARCGQLYDPSLHHACLDGSTARSILSSALTGTRPYDQAGAAIKKLADHGYSIVPTPCRHSTYHHGCPSCDRQDPVPLRALGPGEAVTPHPCEPVPCPYCTEKP